MRFKLESIIRLQKPSSLKSFDSPVFWVGTHEDFRVAAEETPVISQDQRAACSSVLVLGKYRECLFSSPLYKLPVYGALVHSRRCLARI